MFFEPHLNSLTDIIILVDRRPAAKVAKSLVVTRDPKQSTLRDSITSLWKNFEFGCMHHQNKWSKSSQSLILTIWKKSFKRWTFYSAAFGNKNEVITRGLFKAVEILMREPGNRNKKSSRAIVILFPPDIPGLSISHKCDSLADRYNWLKNYEHTVNNALTGW